MYIFIDTNIFRQKHFNCNSRPLAQLPKLASRLNMKCLMPDLIRNECRSGIEEFIRENVYPHFNRLRKSGCLRLLPEYRSSLDDLRQPKLIESLCNEFESYLDANFKPVTVSSENVDLEKVVQAYFNGTPPFTAKKKNEFPDVLACMAVSREIGLHGKLYVASNDEAVRDFFERACGAHAFDSIESLITWLNIQDGFENSPDQLGCMIFSQMEDEIIQSITGWDGMPMPSDAIEFYGTSEDVTELDVSNVCILEFDPTEKTVCVQLELDGKAVIAASYATREQCIYDPEDKELIVMERISADLEYNVKMNVEVTVSLDGEGEVIDFDSKTFDEPIFEFIEDDLYG